MASDFIRNLIFGGDRAAQKVKVMGSIMRKSRGHLTIYKLFRDRIKKVGIYVNDEFIYMFSLIAHTTWLTRYLGRAWEYHLLLHLICLAVGSRRC